MDVQDCIDAYILLAQRIFEEQTIPAKPTGKIRARFDSEKLKAAIEEVLAEQSLLINERMRTDGDPDETCRTYVIPVQFSLLLSEVHQLRLCSTARDQSSQDLSLLYHRRI